MVSLVRLTRLISLSLNCVFSPTRSPRYFVGFLDRRDLFGFVNSGIIDRPFALLILVIDLDEAPMPLNLFVIVVLEALDWSNNNGVDATMDATMRTSCCKSSGVIPKSGLVSSIRCRTVITAGNVIK